MSSKVTLESQWKLYQERYRELCKSFKRCSSAITAVDSPSDRDEVIKSAKQKMDDIEDLLQQMKADLRSLKPKYSSSKQLYSREWHNYSKQYSDIKNEYRKSASKHKLLSMEPHSQYERQRLLHHENIFDHMKIKSQ
eukprot:706116_1